MTREQEAFLRENCRLPRKELTRIYNRRFGKSVSYSEVCRLCNYLKLPNGTGLTEEQKSFLIKNSRLPRKRLTEEFNRCFGASRCISYINLFCEGKELPSSTRFTREQADFLEANQNIPRKELQNLFNEHFGEKKSLSSINNFCSRNRMRSSNTDRRYTEEQKAFIKENIDLPRDELTYQFNQKFKADRSVSSIKVCISKYRLTK